MNRSFLFFNVIFILLNSNLLFPQVENDTLKTLQVTVIKSYTPSLSDAFLIPSIPKVNDSIYIKKNKLNYNLLENQIISTFVPNKAKPLKLIRQKNQSLFNTSFYSGIGNQGQLSLRVISLISLDRNQSFGYFIDRHGYSKDIPNSKVRSNQNSIFIGANHILKTNELRSDSKLSFGLNKNNYYGIYNDDLNEIMIKNIDPLISISHLSIQNNFIFYDNIINSLEFKINNTSDNFDSSEQQVNFLVNLKVPISRSYLIAQIKLNGLNSRFQEDFFTKNSIDSKYLNTGAKIEWVSLNSNYKIKIGAKFDYFDRSSFFKTKLKYYPNIYFEYNKNQNFIPYLVSDGKLILNTYFMSGYENPFLAPIFKLKPTSKNYNSRIGLKSIIYSNIEFDFSVGYDEIENFSLYKRLPFDLNRENYSYALSNAYQIEYRDLSLIDFIVKFKLNFGNENKFLFEVNYTSYDSKKDYPLWNLPSISMKFENQINLTKRINLYFNSYVLGDRDSVDWVYLLNQDPDKSQYQIKSLPIFYSLNMKVNYKLIDEFDVNVSINLNEKNGKWSNFVRHKSLILFGACYKFNL